MRRSPWSLRTVFQFCWPARRSGRDVAISRRRRRVGDLTLQWLEPRFAFSANTPELLANIAANDPGKLPAGSTPMDFTKVGQTTFFTAEHKNFGTELWKTDGTTAGTVVVKDINNGLGDSFPGGLTAFNGKLYFAASDGGPSKLWVSDSSENGTQAVADPAGIGPLQAPTNLKVVGNSMYFVANGATLYVMDGSTQAVRSLGAFAWVSDLAAFNGRLYFVGDDGTGMGVELWSSDGTRNGTKVAADINKSGNGLPFGVPGQRFVEAGGSLYFQANDGNTGSQLWRFNGATATRVSLVNQFAGGCNPEQLASIGGTVFFSAFDGTETELWYTDGGDPKSVQVALGLASSSPREFTGLNGKVYFTAFNTAGVQKLFSFAAGVVTQIDTAGGLLSINPTRLTVLGSTLVYSASDTNFDTELYRVDDSGTAAQKISVWDGDSSFPRDFKAIDGRLYFSADDGVHGREVWTSDGTIAGTRLLRDANDGISGLGYISLGAVTFGNRLYFAAGARPIHKLWSTDGTATGTAAVELPTSFPNGVAEPNLTAQRIGGLTVTSTGLYFYSGPSNGGFSSGYRLWRIATPGATPVLLKSFNVTWFSPPSGFTELNGRVFFAADDGANGSELWMTDGTRDGTTLFRDINAGVVLGIAKDGSPSNFAVFNGSLYFSADDGNGRELWKTDGKNGLTGTGKVADLNSGGGSFPSNFRIYNGRLYFTADGQDAAGVTGWELYAVDTKDSVVLVRDINPGAAGSDPNDLTVYGNKLYFSATTALSGAELWRTDGTTTEQVAEINTGNLNKDSSSPYHLTVVGSRLYFGADDGKAGPGGGGNREVWYTDGVDTRIAVNLNQNGESWPTAFTAVGNDLYVTATDGNTGYELWRLNSANNSITQVADLLFGSRGSNPYGLVDQPNRRSLEPETFALLGNSLLFSADDDVAGQELWKISLDNTPPAPATPIAPAGGAYAAGAALTFFVPMSEVVTVIGTPQIPLTVGSATRQAVYVGGTGTASLTFRYTVAAGDNAPAGIVVGNAIGLNGGTIRDAANNDAILSVSPVDASGVKVDTAAPTAGGPTVAAGRYGIGSTIDVVVPFSEAVTVAGVPQIALTVGGTVRQASYVAGSGTASVTFRYTVAAGDNGPAGIVVGNAIGLNGGTIRDAANNDAILSVSPVDASGVKVDTFPAIVSVTPPAPGTYATKSVVRLSITFSEIVKFSKKVTPTISIVVGKTARKLTYVSGVGTNTLVFTYKVVAADRHKNLPLRITSGIVMPKNVFVVDAGGKRLGSYAFQTVTTDVFLGKA